MLRIVLIMLEGMIFLPYAMSLMKDCWCIILHIAQSKFYLGFGASEHCQCNKMWPKNKNKNKKSFASVVLVGRIWAFNFLCSRTFLSIIGGVIAGILGFTSLTGFIFYFLVMAITSVGLIAKSGFSIHSYFDSWNRVIFDGFLSGLMVWLFI